MQHNPMHGYSIVNSRGPTPMGKDMDYSLRTPLPGVRTNPYSLLLNNVSIAGRPFSYHWLLPLETICTSKVPGRIEAAAGPASRQAVLKLNPHCQFFLVLHNHQHSGSVTCRWLTMQYSWGSSKPQVDVALKLWDLPMSRFPVAG